MSSDKVVCQRHLHRPPCVARRASREAKSMREESGSDEDTSSNEEWDPVQEQDEEDEGNQGIVDASTYGRSRLHQMPRAREDGRHGRGGLRRPGGSSCRAAKPATPRRRSRWRMARPTSPWRRRRSARARWRGGRRAQPKLSQSNRRGRGRGCGRGRGRGQLPDSSDEDEEMGIAHTPSPHAPAPPCSSSGSDEDSDEDDGSDSGRVAVSRRLELSNMLKSACLAVKEF